MEIVSKERRIDIHKRVVFISIRPNNGQVLRNRRTQLRFTVRFKYEYNDIWDYKGSI
jgi:hypothetical protein